jgi:hypothetical protein
MDIEYAEPGLSAPRAVTVEERRRDAEHLRLLAIFHFVVAGLATLFIGFLVLHFSMFYFVFANPEMWKGQKNPPPAEMFEMFHVFIWFYAAMGLMLAAGAVGNLCSGLFLRKQTHRTFSLVVAGLDCTLIPWGTVLGVFTIVILSRDSVRAWYEAKGQALAAGQTTAIRESF